MKVMIDAGHGNSTPGKRAPDDSMHEHQFNNHTATYLQAELMKYKGVQTNFAHDPSGVTDMPLNERTNKANKWKADIFISIHANAFTGNWHSGGGIETYVYITKPKEAYRLANAIQSRLIHATGLNDRGVKTANFHVLRETAMPAVLVECGFMDNYEELVLLKSEAYRKSCAKAIAQGIVDTYDLKLIDASDDIKQDHSPNEWSKEAVKELTGLGITDGTRLKDPATREEVIVMLHRLSKIINNNEV